jgi:SAM-dependent methyltransferase
MVRSCHDESRDERFRRANRQDELVNDRAEVRRLAGLAAADGAPTRWFEELYQSAAAGNAGIPWAENEVNPHLASWRGLAPDRMRTALVVGCGFGDDAEWLAGRGLAVTAFDIAPSAVLECQRRFPASNVRYQVADLLDPPEAWLAEPFDLVVEIYTVQSLPPGSPQRPAALTRLVQLTGDTLLVIARGRSAADPEGQMPWPLLRSELDSVTGGPDADGALREIGFADFLDDEDPPVRRFVAQYQRER